MISKQPAPTFPLCERNMVASIFFCCKLILLCALLLNSGIYATNTIPLKGTLKDGQTLISAGGRFELGFFTPDGRSDKQRYVGIWYYKVNPKVVVWVANRGEPLLGADGHLAFKGGDLEVLDNSGHVYWSTHLGTSSSRRLYREAILLDSGNLVLRNELSRTIWESFQNPSDTFLSGMKMDQNLTLTSWTSQIDPTVGNFTFEVDQKINDQLVISKNHIQNWKSGAPGDFSSSKAPPEILYFLDFDKTAKPDISHSPASLSDYNNTRIVMNFTGEIQYWHLDVHSENWPLLWREPKDRCSFSEACGSFGSCNSNHKSPCKCLPGFKPKSSKQWNDAGDFFGGCTRNPTECGYDDMFLNLTMMSVEDADSKFSVGSETYCRNECLKGCKCTAYSFRAENSTRRGIPSSSTCWIWIGDLNSLQEEYDGGHDLFVRVSAADLGLIRRSYAACGTNAIPYPLSTGSNCGDPMYLGFYCNKRSGQLTFKTPAGTYKVTNIDPTTNTFVIQAEKGDNCGARNNAFQKLNQSLLLLPFKQVNATDFCGHEEEFNSDNLLSDTYEIEISWNPPMEPSCYSSADCKDWPNSTCNVKDGQQRCLCNANFKWNSSALNCTILEENHHPQVEESSGRNTAPLTLIIGVTVASCVLLSCATVCMYIYCRRKVRRQSVERNAAVLYGTEKRVKDMIESEDFKEEDKKAIDVPFFDLRSILAATDNFSDANKLGRGGFGPVYRGIFPGGEEIAIKRLSSVSGQGLEEFKNEVVLIGRLQHRNLVRLLGYCIKGDEKILLYEYMPNKSLDSFIFDKNLSVRLNWEMRFDIILGVARGLLYLHQDSRLRIIHRDLKTSNILLDAEMNPKISDFGLARMFEGKQTEGSTTRVVGTYGYMSPEYGLDGLFSVKSDVFSFGVVVLEILSGRRNTGFYKTGKALNLLGFAWKLWSKDKALDLMDETLNGSCKRNEFMKGLHIALLCVQDDPADRPTMSNIIVMLGSNDTASFPSPKQPAFVDRKDLSSSVGSSSSKQEISTDWISTFGGR